MAGKGFDEEKIDNFFRGKHSDEDESYLYDVICDNNHEKNLKHLLSRQFDELISRDDNNLKDMDHILYRLHYEMNMKHAGKKGYIFDNVIKWTLRIAAILFLPLIMLFTLQTSRIVTIKKVANLNKETWIEIKAPAWTRAQFSRPDGTTGWLNSNSSIKYNGDFNSDRQVTLTGEALFDVYKDINRPFVVNTSEVILKVLGTKFNIASYENERNVEVVLEEGKLIFNDKDFEREYTMKPNDMVIYDKTLKVFSTEVVQPNKYLSWTEGKLVFRNDPLDVITRRMERWYNIDIEVNVRLEEDLRLRATFIDDNLEEVLDLLKRSLPIDYKILNGNLKPDETHARKKVILFSRKDHFNIL
jgi:hypothetical protein